MPSSNNLIHFFSITNMASFANASIKLAISSAPHFVGVKPCLSNPFTNPISFLLPDNVTDSLELICSLVES